MHLAGAGPQDNSNFEVTTMRLSLRAISLASCVAALLAAAPLAHSQITGTVYEGLTDANAGNAGLAANFASTLPFGTFAITGSGINFASPGDANVSNFLNNPTFLTTHNGTNELGNPQSFDPNGSVNDTEVVLTGSIFLNAGANSFQVGHDDGVVLTILGTGTGLFGDALNDPGPTSFVTTPFSFTNTNAAGNYTFVLDYAECCGPPADLLFTVNTQTVGATPEPSSFALLGTGLFAAAGIVRRRIFC
jgi:hypothetical protein